MRLPFIDWELTLRYNGVKDSPSGMNHGTSMNFAIIGIAGYIAPRHLEAIHATGNAVIAALDPHDSVGILDRYFPDASFFTEYERFDRHLEKLRRRSDTERVHYVTVCSPNYLHDAHIRAGLRVGADVICEKPLVINPWNLDALAALESETGKRVYTVLQLRLTPALIDLKQRLAAGRIAGSERVVDVDLSYVTRRGKWYDISWKGSESKSGGVSTNIGIHLFDLLIWLFGNVRAIRVFKKTPHVVAGYLELEWARVRWFLSIRASDLPEDCRESGKFAYRSITIDGQKLEFSDGFTDAHKAVYTHVLEGYGFGIEDARPSIELAYQIRNAELSPLSKSEAHPYLLRPNAF